MGKKMGLALGGREKKVGFRRTLGWFREPFVVEMTSNLCSIFSYDVQFILFLLFLPCLSQVAKPIMHITNQN